MIKLNGLAPSYPHAACADHPKDTFFPAKGGQGGDFRVYHAAVEVAKAICNTCPHQLPCYTEARDRNETFGIWGGVNFSASLRRRTNRKEPEPCHTKHTTTPPSPSPAVTPISRTGR